MDNDEKFEEYIYELRKEYQDNPKEAIKEAKTSLKRIKARNENKKLIIDIEFDKLMLCVLIILIALTGFLNVKNYLLYLFGMAFFMAGYFTGLHVKGFGLIFLFSHGGIGMGVMIGALMGEIFQNPALQDGATNIYLYMGLGVILIIMSFMGVVLYNLSNNWAQREHTRFLPLVTFFVVFLMSGLLPHIFKVLYALKI